MESILASVPEPKTEAEYEAALNALLQQIDASLAQMEQNRVEIERLRAEAQVIAAHTDTVLAGLTRQLDRLATAS